MSKVTESAWIEASLAGDARTPPGADVYIDETDLAEPLRLCHRSRAKPCWAMAKDAPTALSFCCVGS